MWDKTKTANYRNELMKELTNISEFLVNEFEEPGTKHVLQRLVPTGGEYSEETLELSQRVSKIFYNVLKAEATNLQVAIAIIDAGENAPMTDVVDILGKEHCHFNFSCSDYLKCVEAARNSIASTDVGNCQSCGSQNSCTSCAYFYDYYKCHYLFNYDLNRYVIKAAHKAAEDICKNHYHGDRYSNCQECPHYKACSFYKYLDSFVLKDTYVMENYKERWKDIIAMVNAACESDEDALQRMLDF